jgi:hypothetical protein
VEGFFQCVSQTLHDTGSCVLTGRKPAGEGGAGGGRGKPPQELNSRLPFVPHSNRALPHLVNVAQLKPGAQGGFVGFLGVGLAADAAFADAALFGHSSCGKTEF